MRRWIWAVALGLALAAGGCEGSGPSDDVVPSAGSEKSVDDPAKLAKCLRDNGIDVKDPAPGSEGLVLPDPGPALTAALEKCKQFGSGGSGRTGADPNDPEQQEMRRKFATCMREEGVDWPDPVAGQPMEMPQQSPRFMAAFEKCSKAVPR